MFTGISLDRQDGIVVANLRALPKYYFHGEAVFPRCRFMKLVPMSIAISRASSSISTEVNDGSVEETRANSTVQKTIQRLRWTERCLVPMVARDERFRGAKDALLVAAVCQSVAAQR